MYGDNTACLREALGTLMQITRNSEGPLDLHPEAIDLVGSFRHSVTVWCQQAVRASNPDAALGGKTPRTRGPAEELRFRLAAAHSQYTAPLPSVDQLVTPQQNQVVDLWQQAAKAAALGEHDFPAGLTYGYLTDDQAMTILRDASEVARALAVLDRCYTTTVPGWEPIEERDLLGRAATVCAAYSGYTNPDYTIDRRGWLPPVRLANGPALSGLAGVLQAENNLLVRLQNRPDAYSLRLIFDSQRIVSHHAATVAQTNPGSIKLAVNWTERSTTYALLIEQTRNLRGLIGTGTAAADGASAASRIRNLRPEAPTDQRELHHLNGLFSHIDRRLADTIRKGADDRSYLMRIHVPYLDLSSGGAVKQLQSHHIPLDLPPSAPVLDTAKNRLMPAPTVFTATRDSAPSREVFIKSIGSGLPRPYVPSQASGPGL